MSVDVRLVEIYNHALGCYELCVQAVPVVSQHPEPPGWWPDMWRDDAQRRE